MIIVIDKNDMFSSLEDPVSFLLLKFPELSLPVYRFKAKPWIRRPDDHSNTTRYLRKENLQLCGAARVKYASSIDNFLYFLVDLKPIKGSRHGEAVLIEVGTC